METIAERLGAVKAAIAAAERQAGRPSGTVQLLVVSKAQSAAAIRAAYHAGQHAFGENYLQEAWGKMTQLNDLPLEWHYIGNIQSNKARLVAEHFSWAHGVDREKIAVKLDAARPEHLPPLNVCIQVNVSNEENKGGCTLDALPELADRMARLPRLKLRGLMAIPEPGQDALRQQAQFRQMRLLQETLVRHGHALDTLSMGMSGDFPLAIGEGATLVRVGTAVFGQRPARFEAHGVTAH